MASLYYNIAVALNLERLYNNTSDLGIDYEKGCQIFTEYYCYEFKLIYVLIVLSGNWVKTDLSVKQCSPIRWEIFPGTLAFCKKAVERVNSEKNILNSSVECVEWSGFF